MYKLTCFEAHSEKFLLILSNAIWVGRHRIKNQNLKAMKEFVLIFRLEELPEINFSPDEMNAKMAVWEKWVDGIIEKNILVSRGNRLSKESRVIRDKKLITKGPYVELSEIIGGYIIIRAGSIDEAAEIAAEAPIVGKGTIEVRGIYTESE
jgi:hypothetical protein